LVAVRGRLGLSGLFGEDSAEPLKYVPAENRTVSPALAASIACCIVA
jgi:hypothetical protein